MVRPQRRNADLKSQLITIIEIINLTTEAVIIITTIVLENNKNDNNNPFKVVCPQSLGYSKGSRVIFKHKAQETLTKNVRTA